MPVFCLVFHQWREDRLWGSEDGHREVRNHQSHKLVKHCSLLRATPLRVVLELESINSKNAVLAQLQSQCKPGCGMFLAVGVEDQVIRLWTIRLFTYNHFSLELEKIHEHVHANVHKGVQAKPCWQDSYPSHWDAGMRQCEKEIMKLIKVYSKSCLRSLLTSSCLMSDWFDPDWISGLWLDFDQFDCVENQISLHVNMYIHM